ncbi:hypothetical protein Emed_000419 [Eimeria media]
MHLEPPAAFAAIAAAVVAIAVAAFAAAAAAVTLPLTIVGGIVGRRRALRILAAGNAFPCRFRCLLFATSLPLRCSHPPSLLDETCAAAAAAAAAATNKLAREVPRVKWYRRPMLLSFASAILPFSGVYVELYYLFLSVWSSSTLYTYTFLLLTALLLLLAVAAVSVLLTYLQLNAEDHRWHWPAFWTGGHPAVSPPAAGSLSLRVSRAVSVYFLLHCLLYYLQSDMRGGLQLLHFTLYSLLLAWGVCLSLGCVSFFASAVFVYAIYSRVKAD